MSALRTAVAFLGLSDADSNISFNKSVTAVAMALFGFAVVTERNPSWSLLSFGVIVIGAGFGLRGFLGAIKQNTLTVTESTTRIEDVAAMEAIRARRDDANGIDPA